MLLLEPTCKDWKKSKENRGISMTFGNLTSVNMDEPSEDGATKSRRTYVGNTVGKRLPSEMKKGLSISLKPSWVLW